MKILRTILLIGALVVIVICLAQLNYNDLSYSENGFYYNLLIAMVLVSFSTIGGLFQYIKKTK